MATLLKPGRSAPCSSQHSIIGSRDGSASQEVPVSKNGAVPPEHKSCQSDVLADTSKKWQKLTPNMEDLS